jgi:hypothetical protein
VQDTPSGLIQTREETVRAIESIGAVAVIRLKDATRLRQWSMRWQPVACARSKSR